MKTVTRLTVLTSIVAMILSFSILTAAAAPAGDVYGAGESIKWNALVDYDGNVLYHVTETPSVHAVRYRDGVRELIPPSIFREAHRRNFFEPRRGWNTYVIPEGSIYNAGGTQVVRAVYTGRVYTGGAWVAYVDSNGIVLRTGGTLRQLEFIAAERSNLVVWNALVDLNGNVLYTQVPHSYPGRVSTGQTRDGVHELTPSSLQRTAAQPYFRNTIIRYAVVDYDGNVLRVNQTPLQARVNAALESVTSTSWTGVPVIIVLWWILTTLILSSLIISNYRRTAP